MGTLAMFNEFRTEVTDTPPEDDVIDRAADALYPEMCFAMEELVIKKYGAVPEAILRRVFKRIEERTRDQPRPVVYLEINSDAMKLDLENNKTELYRGLVGRVLDAVEQTRFKDADGVKRVRDQYERDFEALYSEKSPREYTCLLKKLHNEGCNLKDLIHAMVGRQFHGPFPLINITVVPNFQEGSVTVRREVEQALMKPDSRDFEIATAYASNIMQSFFLGGQGLKKTVAVPGWTIDVLGYSWENQPWRGCGWAEGGIHEELSFRKIINL